MKIKKIRIRELKKDKVKEINFKEDNLTIIYGENGSGKTTLLKIIGAIFSKDLNFLKENRITEVEVIFSDEKKIKIDVNKNTGIEEIEKLNIKILSLGLLRRMNTEIININENSLLKELIYFFEREQIEMPIELKVKLLNFLKIINREKLKELQIKKINKLKHSKTYDLDIFEINILEKLINNEKKNLKFDVIRILKNNITNFFYENDSNKKNYTFDKNNILKIKKLLENINILEEDCVSDIINNLKNVLLNYLNNLSINNNKLNKILNELEKLEDIDKKIENFFKILNNFFHKKKIIIENNSILIDTGDRKHHLEELSSGEKQIMIMLSTIYFTKRIDIFLIDEPEISLHMEWQEKLIDTFKKILPNTQIIVATHSSNIVYDKFDNLVEIKYWGEKSEKN